MQQRLQSLLGLSCLVGLDYEPINDRPTRRFAVPPHDGDEDWLSLSSSLRAHMAANAQRKVISTKQGHVIEYQEMKAALSKPIIDEIDMVLGRHYRFSEEELDFIINYAIKHRMGRGAEEED